MTPLKPVVSVFAAVAWVAIASSIPRTADAQEVPAMQARHSGESHLFHVTLVLADNDAARETPSELPQGVRQALEEIREILPFKSYRLLDATLARTDGRARVKLNGPNGDVFTARLQFRPAEGEAAGARTFLVDDFSITRLAKEDADAKPLGPGIAPRAPESPLTASFRIREGETVVVGSSRIDGGSKALIVLLTAMQ
jgi:hypothetical protein